MYTFLILFMVISWPEASSSWEINFRHSDLPSVPPAAINHEEKTSQHIISHIKPKFIVLTSKHDLEYDTESKLRGNTVKDDVSRLRLKTNKQRLYRSSSTETTFTFISTAPTTEMTHMQPTTLHSSRPITETTAHITDITHMQPTTLHTFTPNTETTASISEKTHMEPTTIHSSRPINASTAPITEITHMVPTTIHSSRPITEMTAPITEITHMQPTTVHSSRPSTETMAPTKENTHMQPTTIHSSRPITEPTAAITEIPYMEPTTLHSFTLITETTAPTTEIIYMEPTTLTSSRPSTQTIAPTIRTTYMEPPTQHITSEQTAATTAPTTFTVTTTLHSTSTRKLATTETSLSTPSHILSTPSSSPDPAFCDRQYSCEDCRTVRVCAPTKDGLHFYEISHFQCPSLYPWCDPDTGSCSTVERLPCGIGNFTCMRDGYFPDLADCSKYYICVNRIPLSFTCEGVNSYYSPHFEACQSNSSECVNGGTLCSGVSGMKKRVEGANNLFVYCAKGVGVSVDRCIGGYQFSEAVQGCVQGCPHAGLFPDDSDCAHYYRCSPVTNRTLETQFKISNFSCPSGQGFSESAFECLDRSLVPNCQVNNSGLFNLD